MTAASTNDTPAGQARAERANLARTMGLDVLGPSALHHLLTRQGVDAVTALVISGSLPALGIALDMLGGRRIGGLSVLVLGSIVVWVLYRHARARGELNFASDTSIAAEVAAP